jgi:hypothetical protein
LYIVTRERKRIRVPINRESPPVHLRTGCKGGVQTNSGGSIAKARAPIRSPGPPLLVYRLKQAKALAGGPRPDVRGY